VLSGSEMVCPCDCGRLSRYARVFLLADKGETFGFVKDLILRLKNERHGDHQVSQPLDEAKMDLGNFAKNLPHMSKVLNMIKTYQNGKATQTSC
jgi:hypothetical protein